VIEHLGEQAITTSSSNVSFLNADREKIVTAVPDDEQMRVSGSVVYDFHDYRQDRRKFFPDIALPEPEQPERSWVNLQWFREPVPEQAAFLEVVFSGERFTLRLKKQRWRRTCSTRILSSDRSVSIPQRQLRLEHLMVDIGTWNRLNPEAQQEFRELRERFQLELQRRGITDGLDFAQLWQVQPVEGCWMIGNGTDVLEGIASSRQEVIKALFADAVQNLNR
jgi:hypothetical protein